MHVSLNYGLDVMINQMVLKTGFKMIIASGRTIRKLMGGAGEV